MDKATRKRKAHTTKPKSYEYEHAEKSSNEKAAKYIIYYIHNSLI